MMFDIKSAHMVYHVRKGRILAEFLKIGCANNIRIGRILERLRLQANE